MPSDPTQAKFFKSAKQIGPNFVPNFSGKRYLIKLLAFAFRLRGLTKLFIAKYLKVALIKIVQMAFAKTWNLTAFNYRM